LDTGIYWRRALVAISGMMFGFAGACKWTAVNTFGAVVLITVLLLLAGRFAGESAGGNLKRQIRNLQSIGVPALGFAFLLLPAVTYSCALIPIFVTTHTPFSLGELVSIQIRMLTLSKGVTGNNLLYSPWYRWPLMASPMRGLSYLLGNVVVMWGGVLAVAICCWRLFKSTALAESFVVLLYVLNLLQWAVTPRPVTYYYYYYPSAMFLGTALAVALRRTQRPQIFGVRLTVILPVLAALVFLYCYPRMAHLDAPWDCMFGCWN
jgi:dolichyl-phosphate-mannose--protein O-mannosyl transferase